MGPIVTKDYIDGIKEGRKTLKRLVYEGIPVNAKALVEGQLEFVERLKVCAYSASAMDFAKGELHFWENQAEKQSKVP